MHISTTIPLTYRGERRLLNATGFPSDFEIQQFFEGWGFGLARKLDAKGEPIDTHVTTNIEGAGKVDCKTTLHYRDIAITGISTADAHKNITKEIEKFCIFYGALPKYQAHIYVTRVSSGSISIFISAKDLGIAASSFIEILEVLRHSSYVEQSKLPGSEVRIFSENKSDVVAEGVVSFRPLGRLIKSVSVDLFLAGLLTTFLVLYHFFSRAAVFTENVFLSTNSAAIFQSLVASWVVLVLSILVQVYRFRTSPIDWKTF
ncbi:hypothetical protein [Shimia sp.]|uniref:hypothetical protein n=1 Tax=Shimia sp. TaxID=1954381 RepID=UPI003BA9725F